MATSLDVKFTVDTRSVVAALAATPRKFAPALRIEVGDVMTRVKRLAARVHEYKNHTHAASKSMESSVNDSGTVGQVKIMNTPAPYAARLHDGGKGRKDRLGRRMTNKPDPYLDAAFDNKIADIEKAFAVGIDNAIKVAGF